MIGLESSKLRVSDWFLAHNINCLQAVSNAEMVEKIFNYVGFNVNEIKLTAYQRKLIIVQADNRLSELNSFDGDFIRLCVAQICTPKAEVAKKSKKSKSKTNKPASKTYVEPDGKWRAIRYKALRRDGGKCCLCGRGAKDGIVLHVDHIKPKSLYPLLKYDLDNLQVLCADCNIGKSNTDCIDWR